MNIEKLAKHLKEFTLDEINMIAECDCKTELEHLLNSNKIYFEQGLYKYKENINSENYEIFITPNRNIQNISSKDAFERFLNDYVKNNCKHETYKRYSSVIKYHLLPYFKNKELSEICNNDIRETITNLIKIANENNYNKIKVFDLLTEKEPNSRKVNYSNFNKDNIERILSEINDPSSDVLLAWGTRYKNNTKNIQVKNILENLKLRENVFTFCAKPNASFPKHPGRINIDCCRNCYGRKNKIDLKQYFS